MIGAIAKFFMLKNKSDAVKYAGLSDFLLRATPDEKNRIIAEATRRANEDQSKVFNKARLKVGAN